MDENQSYSSTSSLMDRINKVLGKGNVDQESQHRPNAANNGVEKRLAITTVTKGKGSTFRKSCSETKANTECLTETESDDSSDFDDNISLLECAKISMKSALKETSTFTNIKESTTMMKNRNHDLQYLKSDSSDDFPYRGNSHKKTQNTLQTSGNTGVDLDIPPRFPVVDLVENNNKKYQANSRLIENRQKKDIASMSQDEDDFPALQFMGKNAQNLDKIEKGKSREDKRKPKEEEKMAKLKEKQRKLEEKESKKKSKEFEKATKKAASMTLKAESLDQCMKYMTTVLDSSLLQDGGGSILKSLDTLAVQYEIQQMPVQGTIGWMRNHVEFTVQDDCQVKQVSDHQEENQILMRLKADEFAQLIDGQRQFCNSAGTSTKESIFDRISNVQQLLPNKRITILVTGMDNYMKTIKAKNTSKKKLAGMAQISKNDMEEILLDLQLQFNCCVHFCETMEELAELVRSFTKAVAEKPYKKIAGTAFNIYMNNHEKGLPKVTKDGHGLLEVWVKQLQQFKGVGHDTAAAIAQVYPSPRMLMEAYERCHSEQEGRFLLEDIEVRRGHGVLATSRRVGPELSKKVYKLLTSLEGDEELAKS